MDPKPSNVKPRRAYDSTRRVERARATQRTVLDVARAAFVESGYAATTLADIAATAGVSVETIYKAFGNKPGLVKRIVDVAIVGDDEPLSFEEREFVQRNIAEPDARKKLEQYGAHLAVVLPRTGPVLLVVRDAAASDPGAAGVWQQLQHERLIGMTHFADHLESGGHLRDGLSAAEARDVLWLHNSVELWDLLVRQRGWTASTYGTWVAQQLIAALLPATRPRRKART